VHKLLPFPVLKNKDGFTPNVNVCKPHMHHPVVDKTVVTAMLSCGDMEADQEDVNLLLASIEDGEPSAVTAPWQEAANIADDLDIELWTREDHLYEIKKQKATHWHVL